MEYLETPFLLIYLRDFFRAGIGLPQVCLHLYIREGIVNKE
jgi:hypothetical protein